MAQGDVPRTIASGLYDQPVTRWIAARLEHLASELQILEPLDPHHAPEALARVLYGRLVHALKSVGGDEKVLEQLTLANRVLELLQTGAPHGGASQDDHVVPPGRRLLAVLEPRDGPGSPIVPQRPQVPLATSDLLVNGPHDVSIGPEVRRELVSADRVDLLCSFLKWSGLRLVHDELRELCARRGGRAVRVLTTVYMSATDRRALDALSEMGAEVRVSYDTSRTRLHAKAWFFRRATGFSTAYVGSSNLSSAAMLDGLEWNVRLSAVDNGAILEKFAATFEQYWQDPEFRPYDPREFDEVITRTRREALAPYLLLDVEPRPHQREILEDLAAERSRGHYRNLVVAATGTGKTVVAALDYKRLRSDLSRDRLLFVAHRREILEQSITTFRVVLRDGAFGETLVAGERPDQWTHVFASVQSLHADRLAEIPPDYFDAVIVDEFHHAAAPTYERVLRHLQPRVLLGLTATPERADGASVLGWFDGRIASELRLWKALDQGLLSPFQYFGVGGAPDVSAVRWSRGRYDVTTLSNVYSADHVFTKRVVQEIERKVKNVATMRALGFCVDIRHAEFMASEFTRAGIRAVAVTAETPEGDRRERLHALRAGEVQCVFSVDLFNEGVDLPDVDTVLFLRPTESATVFLQQLGRGLRRSESKDCLTVLDFIGTAHRRFRFDLRYRAIVGGTRRSVRREIERGFPSLPSGCVIQLDRQAERAVLQNIEHALGAAYQGLVEDLRGLISDGRDVTLGDFLEETGIDLEDLYANGRCWTTLRRAAGVPLPARGPDDDQIERAVTRMLHLDDPARLGGLQAFLSSSEPPPTDDADPLQRLLFVLLGYGRRPFTDMSAAWRALWASAALRAELRELLTVVDGRTRRLTVPLPKPLDVPLRIHATYTLDEIFAAFDERSSKDGVKRIQGGVYYCEPQQTDLLFVTLEKNEKDYSPTTLYNDYAISPERFHWESQSSCHEDTETGRRYTRAVRGARHQVLLFVRPRRTDDRGETMPYMLLGPCFYDGHRSGRPMQIEWMLEHPMPAGLYQETKIAAG